MFMLVADALPRRSDGIPRDVHWAGTGREPTPEPVSGAMFEVPAQISIRICFARETGAVDFVDTQRTPYKIANEIRAKVYDWKYATTYPSDMPYICFSQTFSPPKRKRGD
jgi:hypothetical protein